mgnify:CR=1 FL=1
MASEKRQRLVAKEVVGDNLEAEMAPFCYSQPCSEDVIRVAAYAYAPNLIQKVTELLDEMRGIYGKAYDNLSNIYFTFTAMVL